MKSSQFQKYYNPCIILLISFLVFIITNAHAVNVIDVKATFLYETQYGYVYQLDWTLDQGIGGSSNCMITWFQFECIPMQGVHPNPVSRWEFYSWNFPGCVGRTSYSATIGVNKGWVGNDYSWSITIR